MQISFIPNSVMKLLIIYNLIQVISSRLKRDAPTNNQVYVFPNTIQAPTAASQINTYNYTSPFLSKALNELDLSVSITRLTFLNSVKYVRYNLTKGELDNIFSIVDTNRTDKIEYFQWEQFVGLFVLPFEACVSNNYNDTQSQAYLMNLTQFKTCFDADPKSKFVDFRQRDKQNNIYLTMINTLSNRGDQQLNFYEYLFLKRALFSWQSCQSDTTYVAKSHFNCAVTKLVQTKYILKHNLENVYDTGLKYQTRDGGLIELDFLTFLRISYYFHYFTIFGVNSDIPYLEKDQFLKSIGDDRLPKNFDQADVEVLYQITSTSKDKSEIPSLDFPSFSMFFHMHKLFIKYSAEKPLLLNKSEFLSLLNDELTPIKIVMAVDTSFTNFQESHYQEASLILQTFRPNEAIYAYSFMARRRSKQDSSAKTVATGKNVTLSNNSYYDWNAVKNESNREVFFTMFTNKDKISLARQQYFRAFQLANLFIYMGEQAQKSSSYDKRPYVSAIPVPEFQLKLQDAYDRVKPPIAMTQRKNAEIYKVFPNSISLDILVFLALENYPMKVFVESGVFNDEIDEVNLKTILKDYGMKYMPDTVLNIARKRNLEKQNQRVFYSRAVLEKIIIVQAVASDNMRTKEKIKGLKETTDPSAKFPQEDRRFKSSPFV